MQAGKFKEAIRAYKAIVEGQKSDALKQWSDEGLKKVDESGAGLLDEAQSKLDSGAKEDAKKILNRVKSDFAGLDCAKEAEKRLKEIPK